LNDDDDYILLGTADGTKQSLQHRRLLRAWDSHDSRRQSWPISDLAFQTSLPRPPLLLYNRSLHSVYGVRNFYLEGKHQRNSWGGVMGNEFRANSLSRQKKLRAVLLPLPLAYESSRLFLTQFHGNHRGSHQLEVLLIITLIAYRTPTVPRYQLITPAHTGSVALCWALLAVLHSPHNTIVPLGGHWDLSLITLILRLPSHN
jgi:hypothetical protein